MPTNQYQSTKAELQVNVVSLATHIAQLSKRLSYYGTFVEKRDSLILKVAANSVNDENLDLEKYPSEKVATAYLFVAGKSCKALHDVHGKCIDALKALYEHGLARPLGCDKSDPFDPNAQAPDQAKKHEDVASKLQAHQSNGAAIGQPDQQLIIKYQTSVRNAFAEYNQRLDALEAEWASLNNNFKLWKKAPEKGQKCWNLLPFRQLRVGLNSPSEYTFCTLETTKVQSFSAYEKDASSEQEAESMVVDNLRAEIAELRDKETDAQAKVSKLQGEIIKLQDEIIKLEEKNQELRLMLSQSGTPQQPQEQSDTQPTPRVQVNDGSSQLQQGRIVLVGPHIGSAALQHSVHSQPTNSLPNPAIRNASTRWTAGPGYSRIITRTCVYREEITMTGQPPAYPTEDSFSSSSGTNFLSHIRSRITDETDDHGSPSPSSTPLNIRMNVDSNLDTGTLEPSNALVLYNRSMRPHRTDAEEDVSGRLDGELDPSTCPGTGSAPNDRNL